MPAATAAMVPGGASWRALCAVSVGIRFVGELSQPSLVQQRFLHEISHQRFPSLVRDAQLLRVHLRHDSNEQVQHEHGENQKDNVEQVRQRSWIFRVHVLPLLGERHFEEGIPGRQYVRELFYFGSVGDVKRKRKDLYVI